MEKTSLEQTHKEFEELKKEMAELKDQQAKITERHDVVMDALILFAKETIQKEGIEGAKEIFKKYNVPLLKDW